MSFPHKVISNSAYSIVAKLKSNGFSPQRMIWASHAFAFAYEDLNPQFIVMVRNDYFLMTNQITWFNQKPSIWPFKIEFLRCYLNSIILHLISVLTNYLEHNSLKLPHLKAVALHSNIIWRSILLLCEFVSMYDSLSPP